MAKLIKGWNELRQIPNESETHILEVKDSSAWLYAKEEYDYDRNRDYMEQVPHLDVYLSTHAFYGSNYKGSTALLKKCGFDVELSNWDERVNKMNIS